MKYRINKLIALLFILFAGCRTVPIVPPVTLEEPIVIANLQTVQKCVLWGESGTINLQDIINKKRCAMNPRTVIGTDAKIDLIVTKEVQNAGGQMAVAVHPFYNPWDKGASTSLSLLKKNAKYYDYIAIDYEARWIDFEFVNKCKQFGKPVMIAPLARADSMIKHYKDYSRMEDITFIWWNYSYKLEDWQRFFRDYKFKDSTKHIVLLSIGEKYRKYVSDNEIDGIIKELPLRAGCFSPKNDYITFQKFNKELEKLK